MTERHPALVILLRSLQQAVLDRSPAGPWREEALSALSLLAEKAPASGKPAQQIDACIHLEAALVEAESKGSAAIREAARAFAHLAGELSWARRAGSEQEPQSFHEGHANAIVIGPGGLEERSDCWLGVSLMGPGVQYPRHRHPPEELYVVMTDGDWYREDEGWFTPGPGGLVYNPSGSIHSMRAGERPLLAFWILWGGNEVSL